MEEALRPELQSACEPILIPGTSLTCNSQEELDQMYEDFERGYVDQEYLEVGRLEVMQIPAKQSRKLRSEIDQKLREQAETSLCKRPRSKTITPESDPASKKMTKTILEARMYISPNDAPSFDFIETPNTSEMPAPTAAAMWASFKASDVLDEEESEELLEITAEEFQERASAQQGSP
ncbi:unnamed protein product [Calypogeia fissa]